MNTKPLTISTSLLCLSFINQSVVKSQEKPPNILWISCEDISPYLGCYGDTVAKTPVLDKLASEGMRMTNVCSVSGVCAPSRSAIITGMYPTHIGTHNMRTSSLLPEELGISQYSVVVPPEVKCFTEYLRAAGYFCTNDPKEDYNFDRPITAWDRSAKDASWRSRPQGNPFFAVINLNISHEGQIWSRANQPFHVNPEDVVVPPYYPDTETVRTDIARVYSNITEMDTQVGEILQELEDDGLTDSTIIIFFSDNGGPMPRQKREILNAGLQVPMIIRFPKKEYAGTVNDELVSFIDFGPTMLSLAGVEIPEYMDGQAFLGNQKAEPRKYLHAARDRLDLAYDLSRAVRTDQFVYIKNYQPEKPWIMDIEYRYSIPTMMQLYQMHDEGTLDSIQELWFRQPKPEEELYDFINDPWEVHNLADDTAYQDILIELRNAHEQWKLEYTDLGFVEEKNLVEQMWPDLIQPETENPVINIEDSVVSITCNTEGASIAYQIVDIGERRNAVYWDLYTGPVKLKKASTIYAVAIRIGFKQSDILDVDFGESTDIHEFDKRIDGFIISPNPVLNNLNVEGMNLQEISILDLSGKHFLTQKTNPFSNRNIINVSNLSSGPYILKMKIEDYYFYTQFVKY